jgi:hypothetical protein
MSIPELLAFFAAGSGLVLLFYILQALDRIHATLIDLQKELKNRKEKSS